MDIDFPVTMVQVLTVPGVAVITALIIEWLKQWITERRVLNLAALAIAVPLALVGQFIASLWRPGPIEVYMTALIAFFGASLACFGYETIKNVIGLVGLLKAKP